MVGFRVSGFGSRALALVCALGCMAAAYGDEASAKRDMPDVAPVNLTVVAVHATREHAGRKRLDPGLDVVKTALADLDFDTYHTVKTTELSVRMRQSARVELNTKYTLDITPKERNADRHVRMDLRVEMVPKRAGAPPVNAITTTVTMPPDKQVKLRGLKMDEGELVVVISLKK